MKEILEDSQKKLPEDSWNDILTAIEGIPAGDPGEIPKAILKGNHKSSIMNPRTSNGMQGDILGKILEETPERILMESPEGSPGRFPEDFWEEPPLETSYGMP